MAFILIVGAWFIVTGVVRFVVALASREERGGNLLTASLDLLAGIVILSWPDLGLSTLAVIIGIVLIARGALFLIAGWQLHKLDGDPHGGPVRAGAGLTRPRPPDRSRARRAAAALIPSSVYAGGNPDVRPRDAGCRSSDLPQQRARKTHARTPAARVQPMWSASASGTRL